MYTKRCLDTSNVDSFIIAVLSMTALLLALDLALSYFFEDKNDDE